MGDDASTQPRVRNRRGQGGRLREEIVTAAVGLLDETGEESAITLRSVARRVGIAAPRSTATSPTSPPSCWPSCATPSPNWTRNCAPPWRPRATHHASASWPCATGTWTSRRPIRALPRHVRGVWKPELNASSVTEEDVATLGDASMRRLAEALGDCVAAGCATSTDLPADAVALWLGLHGLAHQRSVAAAFHWPPDIAERVITALAHLTEEPTGPRDG
ncbi:TetR-like C-terminal domain-containing protein [Streptomyces sp. M19]